MSMSPNRGDREYQKFVETADGNASVRVTNIGTFLAGIIFDSVVATYPTTSSEVYTYKTGGVSGTTVATITVTYTGSDKLTFSSVVKS